MRVDQTGVDIPVFAVRKSLSLPPELRAGPAFAVAGIAVPEAFFRDLRAAGCTVTGTRAFRDHHAYSRRELDRLIAEARAAGAVQIATTEKDYVRLLPFRPFPMPIRRTPLTMEPDPLPDFRRWLADAVRAARDVIVD